MRRVKCIRDLIPKNGGYAVPGASAVIMASSISRVPVIVAVSAATD
jgi:hypothetical protein